MSDVDRDKTGFVLIAHGDVAREMLNALEFISGDQPNFCAVALDHALEVDRAREIVKESIGEIMGSKGAIVMTDLFGGAPSNIAMSLLDDWDIEIVAGVNLPMLIHAVGLDVEMSLHEKAIALREYGQQNIFIVSDVLSGKKSST